MIVSDSRKVIFVHNQKTGGVSITKALMNSGGFRRDGHTHEGASQILSRGIALGEHFSFGFVRNPWARLASWYVMFRSNPVKNITPFWDYIRLSLGSFKRFLTRTDVVIEDGYVPMGITRPQCWYFKKNGVVVVDRICRYENFQNEIAEIENILNDRGVQGTDQGQQRVRLQVPWLNKFKNYDYRELYDDESRKLVASWYEEDIDAFGYTF